MRPLVELALTRVPRLYARLIELRRQPNLEKIVFLMLVQSGDVVVDAGANRGYYTQLFSRLVGRRGRVHAFEPVPSTFAALTARFALPHHLDNVELNAVALSEQEGPITMFVPDDDHGQASLMRHAAGSWQDPARIESHTGRAVTLDAYAAAAGLTACDVLKCDVEGAELLVLRGGSATLRRWLPILYLEVSAAWSSSFGYEAIDLLRFLSPLGYRRYYLATQTELKVVDPLAGLSPADLQASANLICCDPVRHGRRLRRLRRWLPENRLRTVET